MYCLRSQANASHHCVISAYNAQMSSNIYVSHNAREDVGNDSGIWSVIDTVSGTAISKHSMRNEAEKDLAIVTTFYEPWPSDSPAESA
jgi:hypothetical protein